MNVTDWARVQTLFEQALAYEPDLRTAFLRRACGDDPALYEEVAALLSADEHTHPLLDGLALDALGVTEDDILGRTEAPETVGSWRLGERVGRGGMGEVFRAERAEGGFAQSAALKLVKRGMDSEAVVRRFAAERQILARLSHPGIARLIDGGLAGDGRPFFAMEFVAGEPITDYCDARRLPVEARLRLFVAVCEAVRYAHRNLVVHRDLKPSNILVAEDGEGRPSVKLLDFGIARLLAADDDALLTQTGHRVLTPAYAAPEQIAGGAVTTATDVYALGGLLYRLLCGEAPVETEGRTAPEVERAVLEAEPRPPSARVTPDAAGALGTTPERLARRLRGDLDTITLVALRKEPERRYGSAAELLDDVERHLDGHPIAARRDSRAYRARKFVTRHRTGVLATAGVVVLVTLLTGFYTTRLADERDRAQQEADKAAEVSAFLQGLFAISNPSESQGERITARALLDDGAARIDELDDQPVVQAAMLTVIGNVYRTLGLPAEAVPLLERAVALRRAHLPAGHPDLAESLDYLGLALRARGDLEAAEPPLREALAIRRAAADGEALAATLNDLGSLLRERAEYEEAEALLREGVAMRRRLGSDADVLSGALNNLAMVRLDRGDAEEAEVMLHEALALQREAGAGTYRYGAAHVLNNLAVLEAQRGDFEAAESRLREVLAVLRRTVGEEHPEVAVALANVGAVVMRRGALDEAEALIREGLAIQRRTLGADHVHVADNTTVLALLVERQGDLAGAEALHREALGINRRLVGDDSPRTAQSMQYVAVLLRRQEDFREAEPLIRASLAINQRLFEDGHPRVIGGLRELGMLLREMGRYDEAETALLDALAQAEAALPPDHPTTGSVRAELVTLYENWGRPDAAAPYR